MPPNLPFLRMEEEIKVFNLSKKEKPRPVLGNQKNLFTPSLLISIKPFWEEILCAAKEDRNRSIKGSKMVTSVLVSCF